jgi:arabinan endo-1,5-alpha-L-arabinosidase
MLRSLRAAVAAALILAGPARAATTDPIAHDPTLIKQGAYYYDVITGDIGTHTYLPMRRSKDLVHWQFLGPVFTTLPDWVPEQLGVTPGDAWAPDISYSHGEYRLYYAASQFATNNSVIGLATARRLGAHTHWVDRGMVLRTTPGEDDFNAIDPDVITDRDGSQWLALGSFWSGIKLRRLDPETGMPSTSDTVLRALATRPDPGAVEGPSIVRRGRFYYLFASFDFCCRGVNSDYRLMVGRATDVRGPYVDRRGVPMLQGGGTELLRGYDEFAGPGGADVYGDLLVHHYYDTTDAETPKLSVRRIRWRDGWPTLSDPLSGQGEAGRGPAFLKITERESGAPVDDSGCGYEGADIRLGDDPRSPCAQWRLEPRGDGLYGLGNRFSNKVAEAAACGTADGTDVAQWGWLDNPCQRFRFEPTTGGFVRVINQNSDKALDVVDGDVRLYAADPARRQEFALRPAGEVLLPGAAPGRWRFRKRVDGYSAVTQRRHRLGGPGAVWALLPGADGTMRLVARDGRELTTSVVRPAP